MRLALLASFIGLAAMGMSATAEAAACRKVDGVTYCWKAHKGTRVKGFVQRGNGGYSYSAADSVNTYGDTGGRYPSNLKFRDWGFDRQTSAGPFDNGFFFDSGIRNSFGGDAPSWH